METRNDAQSRRLSLIDVSSEDDSLIATDGNALDSSNSVDPAQVESPTAMTGSKLEKPADNHERRVMGYQPIENFEVTGKSSKYNLRKSLAWDSAFFTNAGVLEPAELSNIMESGDRSEKQVVKLPGIQEDVNRSCDSLSSLSDSLETLEADLFEDIRASIQKSSNKSTMGNGSSKLVSIGSQFHTGNPSKIVDMESPNKMKMSSSCKNPSANMQESKKTTKNPSFPQVRQKNVARSEHSKQSKVLNKSGPSSISSKKDMLDDLDVKTEKDRSKHTFSGRVVGSMSKTDAVSVSHTTMPKRTVLTKPSSGSSVACQSRSSSSSSFAGNSSRNGTGTSLSKNVKKKVDTTGSILPSSSSTVKGTSRFDLRNKMQPKITDVSACLKSVSKLSPCTSPASSISEWSSETSPSTSSTVKQKSNSMNSLCSGTGLRAASDIHSPNFSDSQNHGNKRSLEGKSRHDTGYNSQGVNNGPAALLPSGPTKPSGLRLPSPKIGFFDGAKPMARTPSGGLQSRTLIPGGLPKGGKIIPSGQKSTAKSGKLQPARSARAIKRSSTDNQQTSVILAPKSSTPLQISDVVVDTCASENHETDETSVFVQNEVPLSAFVGPKDNLVGGHDNEMLYPDQGSAKGNELMGSSLYKMKRDVVDSQLKDVIPPPAEGKCDGILSSTCYDDSGDNLNNFVKLQNADSEAQGETASDLNMVPDHTLPALMNKVNPEDNGIESKDMEGAFSGAECGPFVLNSTSDICKSESASVGKGSLSAQPDLAHDFCALNVTNEKESPCCESQVDSSTVQFELLPADSEIPKEGSAGNSNKEYHSDRSNASIICDTMASPVLGKASVGDKTGVFHDLNGPSSTDVQKIQSDEILIRSLSSQFEILKINEEIVGNSLSPSKLTLQNSYDVLGSSKKLLDYQSSKELVNTSRENAVSPGQVTIVAQMCSRPLVVKESFNNGEEICNFPAGSLVTEMKMNLPLPQNILKEKNSGNVIEMK